ncbi:acyl-CoA synthetase FdrA [Senegalia massiliensis]|uniref:Acyl-CoA synthetase FdrA n=1 Tax=Senegalia massiliensis TaxID=1720316 RepID=A0A845QRX3_9CLOT|nr:acyl-CoA synthetase FdrA [Senegalia massiliensis]NBI05285.1 acyl-CoA synthetase FdrA [Senegalia massiliensis]
MIYGLIKKNTYQDSVNLMVLSSKLSESDGINNVSIMMGTPANKEILENTGMYSEEFEEAGANDICIAVDTENKEKVEEVREKLDESIKNLSSKSKDSKLEKSKTLDGALTSLPDANLALISIPGEYVYEEADRLLDKGINTFIFSDNVSIEDEKKLKEKAHKKDLLVMGPDCGTGIISNIPLAFANIIPEGNIGIVGASGTGIQEVTSIIGRNGGGITHAIGLGGRDLSSDIGAISALDALEMLDKDKDTDVLVFISKPPAEKVKNKVIDKFKKLNKKVVAIFLGERPKEDEEKIKYAWTLEEAAYKALILSKRQKDYSSNLSDIKDKLDKIKENSSQRKVLGLFGGGTLAGEAAMLLKEHFNVDAKSKEEGYMLKYEDNKIIDLGDDKYTQGRPHPMIDPSTRKKAIKELKDNDDVAIVLFDDVLGYGSNEDMASALAPEIKEVIEYKKSNNKDIVFIASICGTEDDIQSYSEQVEKLKEAGVLVLDTNAEAVYTSISSLNYLNSNIEIKENNDEKKTILNSDLKVINMGLESFAETIKKHGGQVVQYEWSPRAGGDKKMQGLLDKLNSL